MLNSRNISNLFPGNDESTASNANGDYAILRDNRDAAKKAKEEKFQEFLTQEKKYIIEAMKRVHVVFMKVSTEILTSLASDTFLQVHLLTLKDDFDTKICAYIRKHDLDYTYVKSPLPRSSVKSADINGASRKPESIVSVETNNLSVDNAAKRPPSPAKQDEITDTLATIVLTSRDSDAVRL